ncbi:hypothetical protein IE81DRAFT_224841 [Ceraceosorus guamensis]|uniref:Uncharacterized protein n=1 Tax=Ceraceosorus guamensis TaxID=1522189 RepID=A0A316W8A4_9BASI|nr:hypothetical protein IE81DRAFT_224841 [Ceraceosorus guamensis]PWN44981.1 hypothetical protein IE81DRAFT_224841 [Ceraceosorus guamensis]
MFRTSSAPPSSTISEKCCSKRPSKTSQPHACSISRTRMRRKSCEAIGGKQRLLAAWLVAYVGFGQSCSRASHSSSALGSTKVHPFTKSAACTAVPWVGPAGGWTDKATRGAVNRCSGTSTATCRVHSEHFERSTQTQQWPFSTHGPPFDFEWTRTSFTIGE